MIHSCYPRQRQVWFVEIQNAHQTQKENVIKVYFDKQGDFYPSKEIYIPYEDFFDPKKENKTTKLQQTSGNLEHYFTGRYKTKKGNYSYWDYYDYTQRANKLKNHYNLTDGLTNYNIFRQSQDRILNINKDSLNNLISKMFDNIEKHLN